MTVAHRAVAARAAAVLLRYPDPDVLATLPTLRAAIAELPDPLRTPLASVAEHYAGTSPATLTASYVDTFDFRRRFSLYLSYYPHGDTRARGAALVAFGAAYRAAGLVIDGGELPDYLPAVLELAAIGGEPGWRLLREHRVGIDLLHAALAKENSAWLPAIQAVGRLLPPTDRAALAAAARLAAGGPPAELVGLVPYPVPGGVR
ncbi:MAG TPA: nitrate reductase molybdenum cofactor assembly chaperone [Micromonosporaceae bacterium]|nr:nitrate reductase molybdenum cofactor assembly chaperone [Micromonosporaceae bacterium]